MSIFQKGLNPGAYQGELTCPYVIDGIECNSKAIRYLEHITPTRLRYRCRKCGGAFQYDISNRKDLNPYAPYRKGRIWKAIEDVLQGRTMKGNIQ